MFFEPKKYKEIMSTKPEFEMDLIAKLRNARVPLLEVGFLRSFLYTGGQAADTYNLDKKSPM